MMFAFCSLIIASALAKEIGGAPTITFCETGSSTVTDAQVALVPNDIASNENLTIRFTGNLAHTVTAGNVTVEIWVDGIKVKTLTKDVCDQGSKPVVPCPWNAGPLHITVVEHIPDIPGWLIGHVSVKASVTDQAGRLVICAQGSVTIWGVDKNNRKIEN